MKTEFQKHSRLFICAIVIICFTLNSRSAHALIRANILAQNKIRDHENLSGVDLFDIYDNHADSTKIAIIFADYISHLEIPERIALFDETNCLNSTKILFVWRPDSNSGSYDFQLSTNEWFNSNGVNRESYNNTSKLISAIISGKDYSRRIRGRKPGFAGEWSEVWNFSTTSATEVSAIGAFAPLEIFVYPKPFCKNTTISCHLSEAKPYYTIEFTFISGLLITNHYNSISVYPNPASDKLYFIEKGKYPDVEIRIYDLNGKVVFQQMHMSDNCIDISNLLPGVYGGNA